MPAAPPAPEREGAGPDEDRSHKRHRFILFQQPLEGFVESGVVGGAVLPAVPDPIQPGAADVRVAWG